jgi:hypothetical protein
MKFATTMGMACCLIAALAGCQRLTGSAEDRIGAAMPVSDAAREAKQAFDALAKRQSAEVEKTDNEYRDRLKVRALECAHGYAPSPMASDEAIREALTDKECFARFDESLVQWIGLRHVGLLLAAPPLRPIPATPASLLVAEDFIQEASFATRAGIAVLQSGRRYQVLDLADGKTIYSGAKSGGAPAGSLSPNGRLLVTAEDRDAVVREAETGKALIRFADVRSYAFFWVGDVGAVYVPDGEREPVFLDFASGLVTKIPLGTPNVEQAVPALGSDSRFALLGFNRVGVIDLVASPQGRIAQLSQEIKLSEGGGWARNTSGLTADGATFFGTGQYLRVMSTKSMQMRAVAFDPLRLQSATATADPDRLYLTGFFRDAAGAGGESMLYSLSRQTLAPVLRDRLLSTRVIYIAPLRRNAVIDGSKVSLLDAIPAGPEINANTYLAQRASAASVQAAARAEQLAAIRSASGRVSSRAVQLELAALGLSPDALSGRRLPVTAEVPADARLALLARNADIEAVGVYEGSEVGKARGASARTGTVQVRVARSPRPVILSLSSYEPVRWVVTVEPGARLAAVLQSGYGDSEVLGAGSARVYKTGKSYAYKRGGAEYARVNTEVRQWTGKGIDTFQGSYTGSMFRVGGN